MKLKLLGVFIAFCCNYHVRAQLGSLPEKWEYVYVATSKGYVDVGQFAKAAINHLEASDPSFTNVMYKSVFVLPKNNHTEVSFLFDQGLGKWNWTICLDSEMNIVKNKKKKGIDKVVKSFPLSEKNSIKSICE